MQIETSRNAGVYIINASGVLDYQNVSELEKVLENFRELPVHNILLDLAGAESLDIQFLASVLQTWRKLAGEGGELKLCCAQGHTELLLEAARFNKVIDMHASREQALVAFAAS